MSNVYQYITVICFILLKLSHRTSSDVETTVANSNFTNPSNTESDTISYASNLSTTSKLTGKVTSIQDEEHSSTVSFSSTATSNTSEEGNYTTEGTDTSTEDLGTVIESDKDESKTTTSETNGNVTQTTTTKRPRRLQFSLKDAIRDIAYYLRAHKFNEYDRRYETNPAIAPRKYFTEFPRPQLRSLHWEVHKHCEPSFLGCVEYLQKRIRYVSLTRADDTAVVMAEQNWTLTNNTDQIKQVDEECKRLRRIGNNIAEPFEGPLERFQWRVAASYYMCWYTMQQVPELQHLLEHCDNFADCLDEKLGPNNGDIRANDSDSFACALYSFCPNPCCPMKHLTQWKDCWDSDDNPCFLENRPGQRECAFNRSSNTDFGDIVLNRWNVTCRCPTGYQWSSRFGFCVDINECAVKRHNCTAKFQGCLNLAGSFRCACKWGHFWDSNKEECIPSKALNLIEPHKKDDNKTEKSASLIRKLGKFFRKNSANTLRFDKISLLLDLLCMLLRLCLF